VTSFAPRPLYPRGRGRRYPFDRGLGGLLNRSGRLGEEKNWIKFKNVSYEIKIAYKLLNIAMHSAFVVLLVGYVV
jgi:hypothetical protein